jgi:hypothetical protein
MTDIITTTRRKFRDAFLTFDEVNNWITLQSGPGMVVSVAGATGGARYLNINSGVTANAETIIQSRAIFKAPCSAIIGFSMSQRIANNDVFLELVEVDPNTGAVIADTTIPVVDVLNARNVAGLKFTGTTATSVNALIRQDGLSILDAAGTFGTTAATGSGPNFIPATLYELTLRTRDVQITSLPIDSNVAKVFPLPRTHRVPDPEAFYSLRIRVRNGAVAPASATDARIHSVALLDDARVTVDFGSVAGINAGQNALPVLVNNTLNVQGNVATDAAIPTNPNLAGVRAANANPAAMSANNDLVPVLATMIGVQVQKPYAIPEATWNASLALTTTTAQALAAAPGAGLKRHITALQAINTGASAVDLIILDGATERWRLTLPINVPVPINFPTELLTTANNALNANLSAAGTVRVNAQGYTAP